MMSLLGWGGGGGRSRHPEADPCCSPVTPAGVVVVGADDGHLASLTAMTGGAAAEPTATIAGGIRVLETPHAALTYIQNRKTPCPAVVVLNLKDEAQTRHVLQATVSRHPAAFPIVVSEDITTQCDAR